MTKKNKMDTDKSYIETGKLEQKSNDSLGSKQGFKNKMNSGKNVENKNRY